MHFKIYVRNKQFQVGGTEKKFADIEQLFTYFEQNSIHPAFDTIGECWTEEKYQQAIDEEEKAKEEKEKAIAMDEKENAINEEKYQQAMDEEEIYQPEMEGSIHKEASLKLQDNGLEEMEGKKCCCTVL